MLAVAVTLTLVAICSSADMEIILREDVSDFVVNVCFFLNIELNVSMSCSQVKVHAGFES